MCLVRWDPLSEAITGIQHSFTGVIRQCGYPGVRVLLSAALYASRNTTFKLRCCASFMEN